jgi:tRNA-dihydrouridine synthase B
MARKHISWYTRGLPDSAAFRYAMNRLPSSREQLQAIECLFAATMDKNNNQNNNEDRERLAA